MTETEWPHLKELAESDKPEADAAAAYLAALEEVDGQ